MPGNPKAIQDSFATGVVSPEMSVRVGLARFANGLISGKNCYPTKTGALIRRRGTTISALTKDSDLGDNTKSLLKVKLLKFDFNEEQTHFIEAGEEYARFGADGGLIIEDVENGTEIVEAATYKWTLSSGSVYYLDLLAGGDPGIQEPIEVWEQVLSTAVEVTKVDALPTAHTEWTWGDFDTLGFDTVYLWLSDSVDPDTKTDGDVVATHYSEVVWPYQEDEIFDIDTVQSADVMWAVHPTYPPANVTRTDSDVWEYEQIVFRSKHVRPLLGVQSSGSGSGYTYTWHVSAEGYDGTEGLASEDTLTKSDSLDSTQVVLLFGLDTISDYEYFPDGRDTIFAMDSVARFIAYRQLIAEAVSSGDPFSPAGFLAIIDSHDGSNGDRWSGSSDSYTMVDFGPTAGQFETAGSIPSPILGIERVRIRSIGDSFSGVNADGEGPEDILPRFVFTMTRIDATHFSLDYVPVLDAAGDPEPWSRSGLVDTTNWIISSSSTDDPIYDIILQLTYNDNGSVAPDFQDTPLQPNTFFSQAGDYPSAVTFFDQRLSYAATNSSPQELLMSRPGDYNSFQFRSIPSDDDPIQKVLPARQANRVRNLVPLYDLVATTGGAIFRIWSESGVVSSRELQLRPQTERGASNLEPIAIFGTALYVSDKRNQVFLLSQRDNTFGYQDSELSIYAEHYFKNRTVVDWAYAAAPDSVLWVVMSDGKFLSFTYIPDQEVWAWSEHDTDGWVESVTSIREGSVDAVYFSIFRTSTGAEEVGGFDWSRRTIERMATEPVTSLLTAVDVDCAHIFEAPIQTVALISLSGTDIEITTDSTHDFITNDVAFIEGARGHPLSGVNADGLTVEELLNGHRFNVQKIGSLRFKLRDIDTALPIDGSNLLFDETDATAQRGSATITGLTYFFNRVAVGNNLVAKHNGIDTSIDTEPYQYTIEENPTINSDGEMTLAEPATHFMLGFGYDSEATTTDFATRQEGARQAQGMQTNPSEIILRVHDTLGLEAATQAGKFAPMKEKENSGLGYGSDFTVEGATYDSTQGIMKKVLSGDGIVLLDGEWDGVGRISIKQAAANAVPFTLLGILEEVIHGR